MSKRLEEGGPVGVLLTSPVLAALGSFSSSALSSTLDSLMDRRRREHLLLDDEDGQRHLLGLSINNFLRQSVIKRQRSQSKGPRTRSKTPVVNTSDSLGGSGSQSGGTGTGSSSSAKEDDYSTPPSRGKTVIFKDDFIPHDELYYHHVREAPPPQSPEVWLPHPHNVLVNRRLLRSARKMQKKAEKSASPRRQREPPTSHIPGGGEVYRHSLLTGHEIYLPSHSPHLSGDHHQSSRVYEDHKRPGARRMVNLLPSPMHSPPTLDYRGHHEGVFAYQLPQSLPPDLPFGQQSLLSCAPNGRVKMVRRRRPPPPPSLMMPRPHPANMNSARVDYAPIIMHS